MIAYIDILSASSVTLKLYAVNSGTQTGTDKSAIAIGSSTIRKSVDLGSLSDGNYDVESTSPPGKWALVVSSGVATFYDDWNEATLISVTIPSIQASPGSVAQDAVNYIYITRNDSYDGTANALKSFTVTKNYTGWTGTFTVRHRTTGASLCTASVTVASSTLLTVSLSSTATAFALLVDDTEFGPHPFDIEMVSGSSKQQAVSGVAIVRKDVTYA